MWLLLVLALIYDVKKVQKRGQGTNMKKKLTVKPSPLRRGLTLCTVVAGLLLISSLQIKIPPKGAEGWISASFNEAEADQNRRVARRTSRRTAARN